MIYGYVYVIECQVNKKKYVGQTKQTPNKRLYNHIARSKYDMKGCQKLYRAMRKYGAKTFQLVESFPVDSKEALDALEISMIAKLETQKNGYNIDNGGKGKEAVSQETREKLSRITTEKWKDANYRERVTSSMKAIFSTTEMKLQNSEKMKKIWQSDEYRKKQSKNNQTTEQKRQKCSAKQKSLWTNENYRKIMSESSNLQWEDNSKRIAFGKEVSQRWKSQEYREKKNQELHQGKTVIAIFPNGDKQVVTWLADFCREHNLDLRAANKVLRKKKNYNSVKGFKFHYQDEDFS